ncbi:MAG: nucleotide-binding protein [Sulfuritalea sp.]|nr:nucleotide-binding protein [Sulfuritalea sp.]
MKNLLSILIVLIAPFAWAADRSTTQAPTVFRGEVLEVQQVESYTYLRLKTRDGETWAAINRAPVTKGAAVTIENAMVLNNFESRAMKRTFQTIVFGNLAGANPHAGMARPADAPVAPIAPVAPDAKVAKAGGPNAKTVAEIITQAASLKDKTVLVRGKVVKYNAGIMGKNWIHLRDGSGSAAAKTNDVLITSPNAVKVGDVVTAKGIVRTDKDFGSGYIYKVIVEEASFEAR